MKKIFVVGYGYVGKAMVNMLKDHYEIHIYEPTIVPTDTLRMNNLIFHNKIDDSDCVLSVICVPTPRSNDGGCDISLVEESIKQLNSKVILIKSTIEIGTTDMLSKKYNKNIVFSPEYIGESKYWQPYFTNNMKEIPMVILGGEQYDTKYVIELVAPVLGPVKNYYQCKAKEAEMIKYMENTFFAAKVTFVNEMYSICNQAGIDFWKVREGWLLDPRINPMHTAVYKDERGFSGKCFPKDVSALVKYSEKIGYEPKFVKEILNSNDKFLRYNECNFECKFEEIDKK